MTDLIKLAIALGGVLCGGVVAFWRLSAWVHAITTGLDSLTKTVSALKLEVTKMDDAIGDIGTDVSGLYQAMHEREKDVLRLEGRMDQTNTLIVQTIGQMQGVQGSTDALWRSLQKLHPTEVPRRASDRSGG